MGLNRLNQAHLVLFRRCQSGGGGGGWGRLKRVRSHVHGQMQVAGELRMPNLVHIQFHVQGLTDTFYWHELEHGKSTADGKSMKTFKLHLII